MSQTISKESRDFLLDELSSIRNMVSLASLALTNGRDELLSTAIETAYTQLQGLVDEFCVVKLTQQFNNTCRATTHNT